MAQVSNIHFSPLLFLWFCSGIVKICRITSNMGKIHPCRVQRPSPWVLISRLWLVNSLLRTRADDHNRRYIQIKRMQNWSKLVFVLILCNSLIVTGEKKNPTLSFLRYRVVPARQVPFPGSPEGSHGNGTWLAGTTLSRRMTAWDSLSIVIVKIANYVILKSGKIPQNSMENFGHLCHVIN